MIRQVVGFHFLKDGIDKLKSHKFSLIIDETIDRGTQSQMSVLGIYFDPDTFRMVTVFIDLVQMPDGKASTIYDNVIRCFQEKNIPIRNIVGFCADTCNVMFGKHHSVSQMLVRDQPWILPVKCSCHMIHLCASHASLKLPKSVEDLCRNVYAHFSLSSQQCEAFQEFQKFLNLEEHKILKAGQTRWLSIKTAVKRILEQYSALKLYFQGLVLEDPIHTNDSILKSLSNKFTYAYLQFMDFNLERLTSFNTLFHSDLPLLHELRKEVSTLITAGICKAYRHQ